MNILYCIIEYILNELINNIPSHLLRLFFYRHIAKISIGHSTSIGLHSKVRNPSQIVIGNNCAVNQGVYLDGRGGLSIGNNVNIGRNTSIYTGSHDYNSPYFSYLTKNVTIKDHAWITSNVIILPGITIGIGSVVAAGSVVTKNVDDFLVVAGNPAKIINKRNKEIKYKTNYFQPLY